jgi:hypothetical protein
MIIKIDNKEYEVKVGNRAMFNLQNVISQEGNRLGFGEVVNAYWDGIRVKGELTKEALEDYVDETPDAGEVIMAELEAFAQLKAAAKK